MPLWPDVPFIVVVKIVGITWPHNGGMTPDTIRGQKFMLKIAFSGKVQAPDLVAPDTALPTTMIPSVISVLVADKGVLGFIWEELDIRLFPGDFATPGDVNSNFTPSANLTTAGQPNPANGVMIQLPKRVLEMPNKTIRICLKGDFVRDTKKERALDGNHLPPWLPKRPTGDGIEGGTFESWFTLVQ